MKGLSLLLTNYRQYWVPSKGGEVTKKEAAAKEEAKEVRQWDLTDEEVFRLKVGIEAKQGVTELMKALAVIASASASHEHDWWEDVFKAHGIPATYRYRLGADFRLRKIWVKGEVEELDSQFNPL